MSSRSFSSWSFFFVAHYFRSLNTGGMSLHLSAWSAKTSETNDSTTGIARGTTQGSCLPGTIMSHSEFVIKFTVFCFFAMDEAGLNPILITRGIPLVNPPKIPPELLVLVIILLSSDSTYSSLFSEPFSVAPENPEPNSMAFTDGMLNSALLRSDSIEEKIGSPKPTGNPVDIDSTIPPRESPFFFASRIMSFIFCAISGTGHRTSFEYLFCFACSYCGELQLILPICVV